MKEKYHWELLSIWSLALWWLFPIITKFTYDYIDFKISLAFCSLFSFFYFLFLFFRNKDFKFLKQKKWRLSLLIYWIVNWIIFYSLYFYWLKFTSPINSSILWLSEIFFSFLLFWFIFTKEKSNFVEVIWAIFMMLWALIVIFPWKFEINYWDLYIIVASFFAPIWNYIAKKIIDYYPSRFLMLFRSLIASIFLFTYSYFSIWFSSINPENMTKVLPYLIFSWIFLFWYSKILWIDAYKYISIPRASTFLSIYPIFTIIYSIILFWNFPSFYQILWLIPIIIWIYLIFSKKIIT